MSTPQRRSPAEEARTLVAATARGALATLSEDGGPWSSLVAFAAPESGDPVLCVSDLAEHGRNLQADARASLLVTAPPAGPDPLAAGRVTLAGRVEAGDARARAAYVDRVPYASSYVDMGDFRLWVLRVERVRWVGGYARMASVTAEEYAAALPDPVAPAAAGAVAHLNADHADALLDMTRALAGRPDATAAVCTAIDRYGLDLEVTEPGGATTARVAFATPCAAPGDLRAATVELARRARA